MPLISLQSVTLSYGLPPLLDGVSLGIEQGERICLVGRNGTGKSTLLRLVAGEIQADSGERRVADGVQIARLSQEIPAGIAGGVFDVVAGGLGALGALVREYHDVGRRLAATGNGVLLKRLAQVQQALEAGGGWAIEQRTERVISRLGLDPDADFAALSGGLQRRVLLARALVAEPDLLLLDEPTNHLDIEAIDWLEGFLPELPGALLFVTHDRVFLRRVATRILELDRGRLTDWPGDYDNYLRRREERLHAEALERARFDRKLSEEEVWIRQGIKARRTRNEGRVRALKAMREQRRGRREQLGQVRLRVGEGERSGRLVVEAEGLIYAWGDKPVIRDLSTLILRGDKVGIIGPNGAGKSTLLKLLLGELKPDSGRIRWGTNLQIAYFDQLRAQLDEDKSVQDNVADGSDRVSVGDSSRHVLSYLKDFLFTPERARQPVRALSGGERNRLLLARLFTQPANLLVMDEPTNDLDAETLELLEELLVDFQGTVLLVSHDRALLDAVVTSTLVLEGGGRVGEYVGGYQDWLRQRPAPDAAPEPKAAPRAAETMRPKRVSAKLGFKETRELEALPARIEALEAEQQRLHADMVAPVFYQQPGEAIAAAKARLDAVEAELAVAYARWEELEGQRPG
ncbi:MAG: ATP-binding cassette domain-containing protein [Chromatiaceae bacterium]|jgi:ATP-binding cassette subfamily F protein uup|nr:ATP-binding cassette domain-containing protein [Chromatiaceae bacterium]